MGWETRERGDKQRVVDAPKTDDRPPVDDSSAPAESEAQPSATAKDALVDDVREQGRAEGERAALRIGILDLCESFGVPMSDARHSQLEEMDVAQLAALRLVLKRDRGWPDGTTSSIVARPPNFGLGGVDTKATRKWSAIVLLSALAAVTLLTFLPAMTASRSVRAFCAAIPIGGPIVDVQAKAEAERYGVTRLQSGAWLLEHPRSLGRATCTVRVNAEGQVTATTPGD